MSSADTCKGRFSMDLKMPSRSSKDGLQAGVAWSHFVRLREARARQGGQLGVSLLRAADSETDLLLQGWQALLPY